jgi:hypothetical protein
MASIASSRFLAMAFGHSAIIAGAVFLTLWMDARTSTRLLVGGIAALVCGVGLIAFTLRTPPPPNVR